MFIILRMLHKKICITYRRNSNVTVAPLVEWLVCSVTVREGVGSSPAGTLVVIPVYTLLRSPVTKQWFVRSDLDIAGGKLLIVKSSTDQLSRPMALEERYISARVMSFLMAVVLARLSARSFPWTPKCPGEKSQVMVCS